MPLFDTSFHNFVATMRNLTPLAILAVLIDFLLLGICIWHLPAVASRARVPFETSERGDTVFVGKILNAEAAGQLATGDRICLWNSDTVQQSEYLEFSADRRVVGDTGKITVRRGPVELSSRVALIPFYATARFVVICGFVGLTFWLIGLFILFSRPDDHAGRMLHWSIILMATTLLLTQGSINPSAAFSVLGRVLMLFFYPLAGAAFLYFSTLYPQPKLWSRPVNAVIFFTPAVLIGITSGVLFLKATATGSPADFAAFQNSYDSCHILLMVFGLGTVGSMVYSYVMARTNEDRRRLQWMMWGFAVGPTPFILLIIIPQILFSNDLVPEEYATMFLIVVPFSLAISFLKYQILDISVLISRSVVYAVLTVFIGAIYISAALLLASAIAGSRISDEYFLVITLSLVIAILLDPFRGKVQRFVDETLFPVRSKYRELTKTITGQFHAVLTADQMFATIADVVRGSLPVSNVAVYQYSDGLMTLQGSRPPSLVPKFQLTDLHAREIATRRIYASPTAVNFHRDDLDTTKGPLLARLGFSVGMPLLGESGQLLGMLVANPRVETKRFDEGEIDLLHSIAHQAEEVLDRLQLQEKYFIEREQKKHAEELNTLKSYFVSSVSHELRTPLTSIRMFADNLRDKKVIGARTRKEYLDIIAGETDRLGRLINNVLDFSRIERGVKEFQFEKTDLVEVVRKSVAAMEYQMRMDGGTLRVKVPRRLPPIEADGDALQEVILNLLSNALKYSPVRKDIRLSVSQRGRRAEIAIADKGLGIAPKDLPHIFEQFFRVKDDRSMQVGGAGLGLTVVKHIVEAHKGTISVASRKGAGSTFTVRIPFASARENHPPR
ncbi:MAG TPA: GAF domain-containing sensor histidine kinase [Bacteroidota bacterium]|nr:GAF domain-containing sensor histidine kinase [Bacteroidota bacterium]